MHLKVFEVSLTKLRRLGYNLAKMQGKSVPSSDAVKTLSSEVFSAVDDGTEAARFFESLRKDNLAKVIAEPSLVTVSGTKAVSTSAASFRCRSRRRTVRRRWTGSEYGTQVRMTPRLQSDHRCDWRSVFEWPTRPRQRRAGRQGNGSRSSGSRVRGDRGVAEGPNARVLRAESSPRGDDGSGVPVASSIPYIGSAFRNVKEERNETAMFVLVRPEIVQPLFGERRRRQDAPRTAQPACRLRHTAIGFV